MFERSVKFQKALNARTGSACGPAGTHIFEKHPGDLAAMFVGFFVNGLSFFAGESVAEPVKTLKGLSNDERTGVGDTSFRNQSAAEGDFADQFPGEGSPAERSSDDGGNFGALFAVTGTAIARSSKIEGHPDLVHRQKCRVGAELAYGPAERCKARNDVGKRGGKAEQRIFLGDRPDHVMGHGFAEMKELARQGQREILAGADDTADAIIGGIGIEGKCVSWTKEIRFVDLDVAIGMTSPNERPYDLGAAVGRKMRRSEVRFHPAHRFGRRGHKPDANRPFSPLTDFLRLEVRESLLYLAKYGECHGFGGTRNMIRNSCFHSIPTPIRSA